MLFCPSKTPDWSNKELKGSIIARQEGERMGEAGGQRENKQEDNLGEDVGARGARKDGASHPGTQRDPE